MLQLAVLAICLYGLVRFIQIPLERAVGKDNWFDMAWSFLLMLSVLGVLFMAVIIVMTIQAGNQMSESLSHSITHTNFVPQK